MFEIAKNIWRENIAFWPYGKWKYAWNKTHAVFKQFGYLYKYVLFGMKRHFQNSQGSHII